MKGLYCFKFNMFSFKLSVENSKITLNDRQKCPFGTKCKKLKLLHFEFFFENCLIRAHSDLKIGQNRLKPI